MTLRRRLGTKRAALGAAIVVALSVAPTGLVRGSHARAVHWPGAGTRVVRVVDRLDSHHALLRDVVNTWDTSSAVDLRVVEVNDNGGCAPPSSFNPVQDRLIVCDRATLTKPNRAGEAFWWRYPGTSHIYSAVAYVRNDYRTRHVMCHEVGHLLGLGHRGSGSNSCLDGGAYPDAHDRDALRSIYAHTDNAQTGMPITYEDASIEDDTETTGPGLNSPDPSAVEGQDLVFTVTFPAVSAGTQLWVNTHSAAWESENSGAECAAALQATGGPATDSDTSSTYDFVSVATSIALTSGQTSATVHVSTYNDTFPEDPQAVALYAEVRYESELVTRLDTGCGLLYSDDKGPPVEGPA